MKYPNKLPNFLHISYTTSKNCSLCQLRSTSSPLNSTPSTSRTATDRHQTVKPRGLSYADCQVGLGIFSVVRASKNWENWFFAKVPNSMPPLHRKVYLTTCLNWLIFCSKQELSTLLSSRLHSAHITPCLTHSAQVALFAVAGEGDIEPGVIGIVFVVCPI